MRQTLPILLLLVMLGLAIAGGRDKIPTFDDSPVDRFGPLGPGEVAILFGGDTNLGGSTPVKAKFKQEGHDWMSRKMAATIESADAVAFVANLEVPITKERRKGKGVGNWSYNMSPKMVDGLTAAGITHVGLANNHMLDRSRKGMLDTFQHLEKAKIPYTGAGRNLAHARKPLIIDAGGTRVAIVAGMETFKQKVDADWGATDDRSGVLFFDEASIPASIAAAKAEADLVVAFPHWGRNYQHRLKGTQQGMAKWLVQAGVDAIVGHHNHAAQGYWARDGVPVLWSLGNLFFGTQGRFGHDKMQPGYGLLARMVIKDKAIDRIELMPMRINNRLQDYQPRPMERTEADAVLIGLARRYAPKNVRVEARDAGVPVENPYFSIDERGVGVFRAAKPKAKAKQPGGPKGH
ncbi:MAG: CapA family protein [Proteobacteria bacterium]|nr:CapA family protein [Pseudomonadota bacterium]